jgi:predicted phage terminase large subunit-like protein
VARARAAAPEIEAGNIYLPGAPSPDGQSYDRARTPHWVQEFIEECAAFPNAAHDDQVDACSQALIRLAGSSRPPHRPQQHFKPLTAGILKKQF